MVLMPGLDDAQRPYEMRPMSERDTICARHKQGRMTDLISLKNKPPTWVEATKSYVLNFKGRVTVPSIKNFQLVHGGDLDYVVLQFGRVDDNTFTMDFQYPMSAIQAFAICLSSFDNKLVCE